MKRLTAWFTGLVGGIAAYGFFRRSPATAPAAEPDPADALKAKLAEARAAADERPADDAGEVPVDEVSVDGAPDVDARRRSVHDRARSTLDEMKRD